MQNEKQFHYIYDALDEHFQQDPTPQKSMTLFEVVVAHFGSGARWIPPARAFHHVLKRGENIKVTNTKPALYFMPQHIKAKDTQHN